MKETREKTVNLLAVRVILYIRRFVVSFQRRNVLLYAAQASYYVIVSGVPLLFLLMNAVRAFAPVETDTAIALAERYLPVSANEVLVPIVRQFSQEVSAVVFSLNIFVLLWSGSRGTLSIVKGLRHMYGLPMSRGTVRDTALAVVSMFGVFFFIIVTVAVLVFGQPILSFAMLLLNIDAPPNSVFVVCRLLFVGVLTLAFDAEQSWLVRAFHPRQRPRVLLGSFLSAVGWSVFSDLFSYYVTHFQTNIYGGFGTIVCFMMWVYWCIVILFCGAIVNRLVQ